MSEEEDTNAAENTQPNTDSEEAPVEEQQSGEDEPSSKKQEWDPETDMFCRDVKTYFKTNPDGQITLKSTVERDGATVQFGKTVLAFRTKVRQEKLTALTQWRLKELENVEGFTHFLEQANTTKPKASPESLNAAKRLRAYLEKFKTLELSVNILLAKEHKRNAEQELTLFKCIKKRRT